MVASDFEISVGDRVKFVNSGCERSGDGKHIVDKIIYSNDLKYKALTLKTIVESIAQQGDAPGPASPAR